MTEAQPQKKRRISMCVGCGAQIHDQYILRVAPDLEWHAACLKCADCHQFLDETCTCFVRDGKTYCKRDYVRLFGTKCSKCNLGFSKNDFVMRARSKIYHIDCFRCLSCSRQLIPGDEFALREDGLFCKADHEVLEKSTNGDHHHHNNNNNSNAINNGANVNGHTTPNGLQLAGNRTHKKPGHFLQCGIRTHFRRNQETGSMASNAYTLVDVIGEPAATELTTSQWTKWSSRPSFEHLNQ